jgi:hypothetical protein
VKPSGRRHCIDPDLYRLWRADERTRTAYPCSLRVIIQVLLGFAWGCKYRIDKPLSLLWFALCCTVLRSRWCQNGVKRLCRAKILGRDFLEAVQMFCVVMDVSLELGYGSGIANRKHAFSLSYLVGVAYSLKYLPSKAVATLDSPRCEYHNGSADQQA